MTTKLAEKREERARLATQIVKLDDDNEVFSTEVTEQWRALVTAIDAMDKEISELEKQENLRVSDEERRNTLAMARGVSVDEHVNDFAVWNAAARDYMANGNDMAPESRELLKSTMNRAVDGLSGEERNQVVGTGSAGGFLTHEEFSGRLAETQKFFGGVRAVAEVIQTATGSAMPWPTHNATAEEGEIVGETVAAATLATVFGQKKLLAFRYSSKIIPISHELLQDSLIDVVGLLMKTAAERVAKIQNRHFTLGAGTTEPDGVIASAANTDLAATGVITYADLVGLFHKVDQAYRQNATWMMHDDLALTTKLLMDLNGRPLWQPNVQEGEPGTLLGKRITYNNHMETDLGAAGERVVGFGDWSKYIVRDVANSTMMMRLNELGATSGLVYFLLFQRSSGHNVGHATAQHCLTAIA